MSTVLQAITYARQLAQTDSNGISDTLGIAFANDALQDMTRSLLEKNIDAAQTQESTANFTSSGTYAFPSDMFMLKTIEVNYADTTAINYLQAVPMDVANIQNASFDWLRTYQSRMSPLYDNRGDTFELFPTPTGTGGMKIFYFLTPTEFTATSDVISYPQSLDYRALSAKMAAMYAKTQEAWDTAMTFEKEYDRRIQAIIRILAPSSQQPIKPEPLHISGFQF